MDALDLTALLAVGFCAGLLGGLVGVGGGVLFVPGMVIFLEYSQLDAQSTSLVAIVAVGLAGAWRQGRYGNLRVRDGLIVGALSPIGVLIGAVIANSVSERALELSFAAVQLFFAWRLARRALGGRAAPKPSAAESG